MKQTDNTTETFQQTFQVSYAYSVSFTRQLFDIGNPLLADTLGGSGAAAPHRVLVYVDDGVAEAHPQLIQRIRNYMQHHAEVFSLAMAPALIPGGERAKNGWNIVRNIMADIGNTHLDRHSFVIVVGGGSVLDSVGFAASIVHRGVRLIRVPTTVLSQNDAGIGVKTGMDEHGAKNFVGTFAPPFAVLADFAFLPTLKDKYWLGGVAEAFKVAIIKDTGLFDFLEAHAAALRARDEDLIEEVIKRTALLHLDHIRCGGDPFESGTARPLDFGHWAAHKLEVLSNYRLGHGQAVAIGIVLDSRYAALCGLLSEADATRIQQALSAMGLPVWDALLEARTETGELEILKGLEEFREHLGGSLTITLPQGIGSKIEVHEMDTDKLIEALGGVKASCRHDARRCVHSA
ncbi:MAG: 3-dehydroquinate synthase [Verrucomicrobia bacterium]|jgi:3-dehydroquinate synthase|nr:3-dehydroquinate synthase [Verrucomicrobiota bacterium]